MRARRLFSLTLVAVLTLALFGPGAWAAPVPSQAACAAPGGPDAEAIAAARELVKGKLMDFGLSEEAAAGRVELLTDEEVHAIAADLDALQAAGATGQQWDTVTVLLLLILVAILAS